MSRAGAAPKQQQPLNPTLLLTGQQPHSPTLLGGLDRLARQQHPNLILLRGAWVHLAGQHPPNLTLLGEGVGQLGGVAGLQTPHQLVLAGQVRVRGGDERGLAKQQLLLETQEGQDMGGC